MRDFSITAEQIDESRSTWEPRLLEVARSSCLPPLADAPFDRQAVELVAAHLRELDQRARIHPERCLVCTGDAYASQAFAETFGSSQGGCLFLPTAAWREWLEHEFRGVWGWFSVCSYAFNDPLRIQALSELTERDFQATLRGLHLFSMAEATRGRDSTHSWDGTTLNFEEEICQWVDSV